MENINVIYAVTDDYYADMEGPKPVYFTFDLNDAMLWMYENLGNPLRTRTHGPWVQAVPIRNYKLTYQDVVHVHRAMVSFLGVDNGREWDDAQMKRELGYR